MFYQTNHTQVSEKGETAFVFGDFKLVWARDFERHIFHVNLAQICSAAPEMFHTHQKNTDWWLQNRTFHSSRCAVINYSSKVCVSEKDHHYLHLNGSFPDEPGLASSQLFFLHMFWNRTFVDKRDRFFRPDVLPVTQPTAPKHWYMKKTSDKYTNNHETSRCRCQPTPVQTPYHSATQRDSREDGRTDTWARPTQCHWAALPNAMPPSPASVHGRKTRSNSATPVNSNISSVLAKRLAGKNVF